jgi:hypothetical protein
MSHLEALLHIKKLHGDRFLHPNNFEEAIEVFREVKKWRRNNYPTHKVYTICRVCHVVTGSQYQAIVHSCTHKHLNSQPFHCMVDSCHEPLKDQTFSDHFKEEHLGYCHKLQYRTLREYMTHRFSKHFYETVSTIPQDLLQVYYTMTREYHPQLHWAPSCPIMLFPVHENRNLPDVYTQEMMLFLRSAYTMINPFKHHLQPNNYAIELKRHIDSLQTPKYVLNSIWRDIMVQRDMNAMLYIMWARLLFLPQDTMETPVATKNPTILCPTCNDTQHHTDPENCIPTSHTGSFVTRCFEKIKRLDFSKIAGVWIGETGTATEYLPHSEYNLLNLTNKFELLRQATGYLNGNRIVAKDKGYTILKFSDYTDYLQEVAAFLPQNWHSPLIVTFVYEDEQVAHFEAAVNTVMAFISQLDTIRKRFHVSFAVLGPLPKYHPGMKAKEYQAEARKVQILSNLLSMVAVKANILVIPLHGVVSAAYDSVAGCYGISDQFSKYSKEPLYNSTGTPTREYRKRVGHIIDRLIESYVRNNKEAPYAGVFLRNILFRDSRLYYQGE